MTKPTTIRVSEEIWLYLKNQKRRGETMDDTLRRLLNFKVK